MLKLKLEGLKIVNLYDYYDDYDDIESGRIWMKCC